MSKCSGIVDGFNPKSVNPGLEVKIDQEVDKALSVGDPRLYDKSNAQKTQIATTVGTYRKAKDRYFRNINNKDILDFGAGLGIATEELGFTSYEPYPNNWTPNYTNVDDIKGTYSGIISNAVLNVIENSNGDRDQAVRDIGKLLKPGGKAFINVRKQKGDVDKAKVVRRVGDGIITTKNTFQKGFERQELMDYLTSILGDGFTVETSSLGTLGAIITKKETPGRFKEDYYNTLFNQIVETGTYSANYLNGLLDNIESEKARQNVVEDLHIMYVTPSKRKIDTSEGFETNNLKVSLSGYLPKRVGEIRPEGEGVYRYFLYNQGNVETGYSDLILDDKTDKVIGLLRLEITKNKGEGLGKDFMEGLMSSNLLKEPGKLKIYDIVKDAVGFWEKVGATVLTSGNRREGFIGYDIKPTQMDDKLIPIN